MNETNQDETACPYCGSENECEHVLLSIDETFRGAGGGALFDVFNEIWLSAKDKSDGRVNFDEQAVFDCLLDVVSAHSDCENDFVVEGGPGQTSSYYTYYCKQSPTEIEISKIKDDLEASLTVLSLPDQAKLAWHNVLKGNVNFESLPKHILEIIIKNFDLSLLPIRLQTELIVALVETDADSPEIVEKITSESVNDIYQKLVSTYSDRLSTIHRYLNTNIMFAREKVTKRHLGYVDVRQRTPDSSIKGALYLVELLAKNVDKATKNSK